MCVCVWGGGGGGGEGEQIEYVKDTPVPTSKPYTTRMNNKHALYSCNVYFNTPPLHSVSRPRCISICTRTCEWLYCSRVGGKVRVGYLPYGQ